MQRKKFNKRKNYENINNDLGFDFQVMENKQYWIEDVGYEFTAKEIDKIESATNDLQQMCFAAIDHVIQKNKFHLFGIPEKMIPYIKSSWQKEDWSLYGRFDFFFDGKKLKMYEYNADTPTSLLEASLAQWEWKEGQKLPDQFNSIDEKMVAWWKSYKEEKKVAKVYFTTIKENQEDFRNTEYIMDTATRAGLETDFIFIEDIGSDGEYLYDLNNEPINHLFKLYPWEWLAGEDFIEAILQDNCTLIEPAWKIILSNKALMAILWELYPNHEYLLPTYFSPEKFKYGEFVKKPLLSREGQNVEIVKKNSTEKKEGLYRSEKNIYQEICILPAFDNYYPVIGSWVVGEEAAGISIREDESKITANLSRFVPHYFSNSLTRPHAITPSSRGESYSEKTTSSLLGSVIKVLSSILVVGGLFYLIHTENEKVRAENAKVEAINEVQKKALGEIFYPTAEENSKKWISSNISPKNQEIFKAFLSGTHKMIDAGVRGNAAEFKEIDRVLMTAVYCIQGEQDINSFETFSTNYLYETEMEKQLLVAFKKKFNYYEDKIEPPNEEDLVEACDFKDFEQDFEKTFNERKASTTEVIKENE